MRAAYMTALMYALSVCLYGVFVGFADDRLVVGVVALVASPGVMVFARYALEGGRPYGIFNPKTQSWAFMFGDPLCLMPALVALSIGAGHVRPDGRAASMFSSGGWQSACLIVGMAAGLVFHLADSAAYDRRGVYTAVKSPSKMAHDFVAYPVLVGGLLYLGVPLVIEQIWGGGGLLPYVPLGLTGVGVWLVLCTCDAKRGLDPRDMHPLWDITAYVPLHRK